MIIEKPWGEEKLLEQNDTYVVKRLIMRNGQQCSLQFHKEKTETIFVTDGTLTIILDGKIYTLLPFDYMTILPNQIHRMKATKGDVVYLECSTNHLDDIVRLQDDYGRI